MLRRDKGPANILARDGVTGKKTVFKIHMKQVRDARSRTPTSLLGTGSTGYGI